MCYRIYELRLTLVALLLVRKGKKKGEHFGKEQLCDRNGMPMVNDHHTNDLLLFAALSIIIMMFYISSHPH